MMMIDDDDDDDDDEDDKDDKDDYDDKDENEAWVTELKFVINSKAWQGGRGCLAFRQHNRNPQPFWRSCVCKFSRQKHRSLLLHNKLASLEATLVRNSANLINHLITY